MWMSETERGVGGVVGVGGDEPQAWRALPVHRLDALDDQPGAVPEHVELAGGGDAPVGVDDDAVAVAHLGLHRVAAHADDAKRVGIGVALVADHDLGQTPARLLEDELLVEGACAGGDLDLHLRDGGERRARRGGRPALALPGLRLPAAPGGAASQRRTRGARRAPRCPGGRAPGACRGRGTAGGRPCCARWRARLPPATCPVATAAREGSLVWGRGPSLVLAWMPCSAVQDMT